MSAADIYKSLAREHREIERLFDQLEIPPGDAPFDGAARRMLAERLVVASSRHEAAEEMVFWPAVRRFVRDGDRLADTALSQEREARYILDALRVAATDDALSDLGGEFALSGRTHVAFEEEEVWPALRRSTTRLANLVLGLKYAVAERLAPTRPHPHGPDRRMGLATTGMVVAGMDRLRDAVSGRHPWRRG